MSCNAIEWTLKNELFFEQQLFKFVLFQCPTNDSHAFFEAGNSEKLRSYFSNSQRKHSPAITKFCSFQAKCEAHKAPSKNNILVKIPDR